MGRKQGPQPNAHRGDLFQLLLTAAQHPANRPAHTAFPIRRNVLKDSWTSVVCHASASLVYGARGGFRVNLEHPSPGRGVVCRRNPAAGTSAARERPVLMRMRRQQPSQAVEVFQWIALGWELIMARSKLYRRRYLRSNSHFSAFFDIYKMYKILHRTKSQCLDQNSSNVADFLKI